MSNWHEIKRNSDKVVSWLDFFYIFLYPGSECLHPAVCHYEPKLPGKMSSHGKLAGDVQTAFSSIKNEACYCSSMKNNLKRSLTPLERLVQESVQQQLCLKESLSATTLMCTESQGFVSNSSYQNQFLWSVAKQTHDRNVVSRAWL